MKNNYTILLYLLCSIMGIASITAQNPTPYCINSSTVLLENGSLEVWAIDFDAGSSDDETNTENLRFTFSNVSPESDPNFDEDVRSSSIIVSNTNSSNQTVDMYVWDEDGNNDYCTIQIYLVGGGTSNVNVHIENEIENVQLTLAQTGNPSNTTIATANGQDYSFTNVAAGSYELSAEKDDDHGNGNSTLDLVLTQRHMLQLKPFEDPLQLFAADVRKDGQINTLDIIQQRRLILGIINSFPQNKSWRFGNTEQVFGSINEVLLEGLDENIFFDVTNQDINKSFNGIKVGDVNNTVYNLQNDEELLNALLKSEPQWRTFLNQNSTHQTTNENIIRSANDTVDIYSSEVSILGETQVCIPVSTTKFNAVAGFQFPLAWNNAILSFDRINSDGDFLTPSANLTHVEDGELLLTWYESNGNLLSLDDQSTLFEICFDVLNDTQETASLGFQSSYLFESGVYDFLNPLLFTINGEEVNPQSGCLNEVSVALDFQGTMEVFPSDFYIGEEATDVLLINGATSLSYECGDIGAHSITLTITDQNDNTETCDITLHIFDNTPPVSIAESDITVLLNEDLFIDLDPNLINEGSYDACGPVTLSLSPSRLDCESNNPVEVLLTATDQSGNTNQVFTLVHIEYPSPITNTMTCNDNVMVSVTPNQSIEITPDMILEGEYGTCYDFFNLTLTDENNVVQSDNILDISDAGQTFFVTVTNEAGVSCWGSVTVQSFYNEVKFNIPEAVVDPSDQICLPVTVDNFIDISGFQFPISWDPTVVTYTGIDVPPGSPFDANNTSAFDNYINLLWIHPLAISTTLPDGFILFEICFEAIGSEGNYSNINFDGGIAKEVFDINNESLPSVFNGGKVSIGAIGSCYQTLQVSFGFDPVEIWGADFVEEILPGDAILINGEESLTYDCEDIGDHEINVQITHLDESVEYCVVNLELRDKLAPYLELENNIEISLDVNNSVTLDANLLIKTVNDNCNFTTTISPQVIDCNYSSPVLVTVTATDESGNSTSAETLLNIDYIYDGEIEFTCNSEVSVVITGAPIEVTASMILSSENSCAGIYTVQMINQETNEVLQDNILNETHIGDIYTVTLTSGQSGAICTSVLTVEGVDCAAPFVICDTKCHSEPVGDCSSGHTLNDGVEWPCDVELTNCDIISEQNPTILNELVSPENLIILGVDSIDARPTIFASNCPNIAHTYTDQVFVIGNFNLKIIRTWIILDWLTGNHYQYDQVLLFTYESNPSDALVCDDKPWSTPFGDCESGHTDQDVVEWPEDIILENVNCDVLAEDLTPENLLNSGLIDYRNAKPRLFGDCHVLGLTYEDITISNTNNTNIVRTWILVNWLTEEYFEYNQEITILNNSFVCDILAWNTPAGDCASGHTYDDVVEWPADITVNSFNVSLIGLSINPDVHENDVEPRLFGACNAYVVTFTDDYYETNGILDKVDRNWILYNLLTNTTYSYLQTILVNGQEANDLVCAYRPSSDKIPNVQIINDFETDEEGCVLLDGIATGTTIAPTKTGNWPDGIDMLDLIKLYKGVLSIEELSPYELIAADINQNGVVSTLDAVLLEQIIYGELVPTSPVWKFVDASYQFPSGYGINNVPANYPSTIALNSSYFGNNFIGVKMGDLDNSFDFDDVNAEYPTTSLSIKDEIINEGESFIIPVFTSINHAFEGLQINLNYNADNLKMTQITSSILPEFSMEKNVSIENGVVSISYSIPPTYILNGGINIAANSNLFSIEFEALNNSILNENLNLEEALINVLKANEESKPYKIDVEWEDSIIDNVVDQNSDSNVYFYPQPATDQVQVKWIGAKYDNISYTIINMVGQTIEQKVLVNNNINVSTLTNGVYLVQMYQEDQLVTVKKLIINN